jgi:hypothetical protein
MFIVHLLCDSTFGNSRQFPQVEAGRSWALSVGDPACLRASFRSARETSAALRGDISRSARPRVVDLSPCPICAYGNLAQSGKATGDCFLSRLRRAVNDRIGSQSNVSSGSTISRSRRYRRASLPGRERGLLILAESGPWKNASLLDCQRWVVNPVPRFLSFGVARGSVRSHSLAALSACKTFQDVSLITKRSGSGDRDTERIRTSLRCQENAADCMLPCEGCLRETRPAGIDPKRSFKPGRRSGRMGNSCGAVRAGADRSSYPYPFALLERKTCSYVAPRPGLEPGTCRLA